MNSLLQTTPKKSLISLAVIAALALLVPTPRAHAVAKEIIQLQTQVAQLQNMVQHLQDTNDSRMAVLQHLVEQSADNINRLTQSMTALQHQVSGESQNQNTQISGQIQSLNDSVDELKTRVTQLGKTLQDIQSQLQNIHPQPAGGQPGEPGAQPGDNTQPGGQPGADNNAQPGQSAPATQPQQPQAAPAKDIYQSALRDFNGARYDLASSEFSEMLQNYPTDDLAPNAQYYLGEIAFRKGDFSGAIKNYGQVLDQFPGSQKAPAAQLRKGEAELRDNRKPDAIHDFRALIQRYPRAPEAMQARSHLNAMGVRISTAKPSAYR